MSGRERDRYDVVGSATREANLRARRARLSARELRFLSVVIDHTTTWSRLEDRIPESTFERELGLHHRDIQKIRARLVEAGVFDYVPSKGRLASVYRLPQLAAETPPVEPAAEAPRVVEPTRGDSGTQPAAGEPLRPRSTSEKNVDDEELDELLTSLGPLAPSQRDRARYAYRENPAGVRRCLMEALEGDKPAGLFDSLIRNGEHRRNGAPRENGAVRSREETLAVARRYVETTGWHLATGDALRDALRRRFAALVDDDVEKLVDEAEVGR